MIDAITSVEVWVKRNGAKVGQLELSTDAPVNITCSTDAEIKMRMTCNAHWADELDYNTDTLLPVIVTGNERKEVGEYIVTASRRVSDGLSVQYHLTGFDLTYRAKKGRIEQRIFFEKGARYTDAISQLLVRAGIINHLVEASPLTLATDREDWEPGTTYISIINQLLSEINYNSLYMDLSGIVRATPYKTAVAENVTISYYDDEASILTPGSEIEIDGFDHPNVFHYICENPENEVSMHVVSENNDPLSQFSISRQGRVPVFVHVDNVPDTETLQAIADRAKLESMISSDLVRFSTEQNPIHNPFEVIAVRKPDFVGIIAETEWTLDLGVEGEMTHAGKRSQYT